jgi:hypothetical protein
VGCEWKIRGVWGVSGVLGVYGGCMMGVMRYYRCELAVSWCDCNTFKGYRGVDFVGSEKSPLCVFIWVFMCVCRYVCVYMRIDQLISIYNAIMGIKMDLLILDGLVKLSFNSSIRTLHAILYEIETIYTHIYPHTCLPTREIGEIERNPSIEEDKCFDFNNSTRGVDFWTHFGSLLISLLISLLTSLFEFKATHLTTKTPQRWKKEKGPKSAQINIPIPSPFSLFLHFFSSLQLLP